MEMNYISKLVGYKYYDTVNALNRNKFNENEILIPLNRYHVKEGLHVVFMT